MAEKRNEAQKNVTGAAKSFKDGADTVFDSVQNAVESTESVAMNAVDKTTDAINKALDNDK